MPRQKRDQYYRVYEYGVTRVTSGEDLMAEQNRQRVRYWNKLVEVERAYWAARTAAEQEASPRLVALEDEIAASEQVLKEARLVISAARQALHFKPEDPVSRERRTVGLSDRRAAVVTLKALKAARKALRIEVRSVLKARLDVLANERTAQTREARRQAVQDAIWWGNYLDVEAACKLSRRLGHGARLKFHSVRYGEQTVSVWFQDGLACPLVAGHDSRLAIEPAPPEAFTASSRGERRRLARTTFRIRVGTRDRQAQYVTGNMVLHRPLPAGGVIRKASLIGGRVASHLKFKLVVVVEIPRPAPTDRPLAVGVDLGWRARPDGGLRVAYAAGHGYEEELALPPDLVSGWQKVEDLESVRDRAFNQARDALLEFRREGALPDWLLEATRTLGLWRSQRRLAAVTLRWRDNRFSGDQTAYEALDAWRKQDKHLWEWEENQRQNTLGRRREIYRHFALRLARVAGTVVLEEFDIRGVTRGEGELPAAARQRPIAADSVLRSIIKHTCAREGVMVVDVPAQYTTVTCSTPGCETVVRFDPRKELLARCPRCGNEWDQDWNAALNLVKVYTTGAALAGGS